MLYDNINGLKEANKLEVSIKKVLVVKNFTTYNILWNDQSNKFFALCIFKKGIY